eukprot:3306280-Pyramimonas_sp.AAC.1
MPPSFETHTSLICKSVQQPLRVIETPTTPHRSTVVACSDSHLKFQCGELFVILVFPEDLNASCRP